MSRSLQVAERTEDTIEQYYDIVEDLDVPTSSKNYSSWKDIVALYDDLDHRIDAICDAWEISLKYAKPADHKNEIVAPLSRDNVAGTNDNKYRQKDDGQEVDYQKDRCRQVAARSKHHLKQKRARTSKSSLVFYPAVRDVPFLPAV